MSKTSIAPKSANGKRTGCTRADVIAECRRIFAERFERDWHSAYLWQLLDGHPPGKLAALGSTEAPHGPEPAFAAQRAKDIEASAARVRETLDAFRRAALAARDVLVEEHTRWHYDEDACGEAFLPELSTILGSLPEETLSESPPWRSTREPTLRARIARNAPRVFGIEAGAKALAALTLLAGQDFIVNASDTVETVIAREADAARKARERPLPEAKPARTRRHRTRSGQ